MDFSWSAEQVESYRQARTFAERELALAPDEATRGGGMSDAEWLERWRKCARFGIQGLILPAQYGGLGLDACTAVYVMEGLGRECRDNGLLMALGAHLWSVATPLLEFGSAEQKQTWLPAMASGEAVGAIALTEPEGGSDVFHLRTRAEADSGGYRLQGVKVFVTNAPLADLFLVLAATDKQAGFFGLTAFLVRRGLQGLQVGPRLAKMGLETSPMAEVQLDGVWVPEQAVLGEIGGGGAVLQHTLEWERGCLLAPAPGTMERLLELTTAHCRARKVFGRPVVEFEAVAAQLAELRLRLEVSRLLLHRFAWLKDSGGSAALEASLCKLYVSESLRRACECALHLHGAAGYTRELEFERDWRDAMASSLYSGTTEMQNNLIADSLLRASAGSGRVSDGITGPATLRRYSTEASR